MYIQAPVDSTVAITERITRRFSGWFSEWILQIREGREGHWFQHTEFIICYNLFSSLLVLPWNASKIIIFSCCWNIIYCHHLLKILLRLLHGRIDSSYEKDLFGNSSRDPSPFSPCCLFHNNILKENNFPFSNQICIECLSVWSLKMGATCLVF